VDDDAAHRSPRPWRRGPGPTGRTLIRVRATRYDAPGATGSLRNALKLWTDVANDVGAAPYGVRFTFTCRSEARADRVVVALRRRLACASARTMPSGRAGSGLWHVQGRTHPLPQSLANLEQVSNWLRELAGSHQVRLVRVSLA
jgi:hypothetical protein